MTRVKTLVRWYECPILAKPPYRTDFKAVVIVAQNPA